MRALPASLPVRRPGPSCGSSGRARRRRVGCGLLRRAPSCASGPRRTLPDLSSDPTGTCQRNGRGPGGGGGGGGRGRGRGGGGGRAKGFEMHHAACGPPHVQTCAGCAEKFCPRLGGSATVSSSLSTTGSPLALGTRRQRVTAVRSHATAAPRPTG
ncbi:unnamed protein product [Prorocentrum cordatum]|uniref:Uncharacterized protein n=1 Tax=Prorocentrum cordatum TaxID=2364126 RepID=A0ABN9TIJ2_9DINO|nr:unnamed protein product [Polarella glacialis]